MNNKMDDQEIEKIAQTIAAKLGEQGGQQLLGCGSASSSQGYNCTSTSEYDCRGSSYECGGQGLFDCYYRFFCRNSFSCFGPSRRFNCEYYFDCQGTYS